MFSRNSFRSVVWKTTLTLESRSRTSSVQIQPEIYHSFQWNFKLWYLEVRWFMAQLKWSSHRKKSPLASSCILDLNWILLFPFALQNSVVQLLGRGSDSEILTAKRKTNPLCVFALGDEFKELEGLLEEGSNVILVCVVPRLSCSY